MDPALISKLVTLSSPNTGALYAHEANINRQKGEMNSNTIKVQEIKSSLTFLDRWSRQKINKEILALNNAFDQMDLLDTQKIFHSNKTQYIFFSSAQGTFSTINNMQLHNTILSIFKKTKSVSTILSDHNRIKQEYNQKQLEKP